ncbi:MAG: hypothetical protein ACJAYY_000704 [Paraglaciecola sp.]|jgi:hypothetical protein
MAPIAKAGIKECPRIYNKFRFGCSLFFNKKKRHHT